MNQNLVQPAIADRCHKGGGERSSQGELSRGGPTDQVVAVVCAAAGLHHIDSGKQHGAVGGNVAGGYIRATKGTESSEARDT